MNRQIEALRDWGCDIEDTMERMANDEAFYVECLSEVVDDPYFEALGEALTTGDTQRAFDAAHTLKGVLANVGLTPMFRQIVRIVEPLRANANEDLAEPYRQLIRMRERLREILRDPQRP